MHKSRSSPLGNGVSASGALPKRSANLENERKHDRFIASWCAFIGFALGIVLLEMMIGMGNACWEFAHKIETGYPGERLDSFAPFLHGICFLCGMACGVFVFRVCRRSVSSETVFHVTFSAGLALLCFCLWLVLISFPLIGSSFAMEWTTHVLTPLFSAPLTCVVFLPTGVLLLGYAIACDTNRRRCRLVAPAERPR